MSLFGRFIMMWGLIWLYFFLSTAISHANKKQSFTGWLRKVYIPEQDVREEVYEMPISPSKNCPPKLYHLVEKYFRPHQKGITVDMINDAFYSEDNVMRQRGVIIIQVINGSIYVDKSMMPFMEFYEKSRLEFLLERVDEFIRKDHKSLVYPNDFEFVFVGFSSCDSLITI